MPLLLNISFASPWYLLLLLLIPLFIFWQWYKRGQEYPELKVSSLDAFKGKNSLTGKLRPLLRWLKIAAFALLVIALARPQDTLEEEKINADGIDIVMVMDISGSMLAEDFEPNRLEAAKRVGSQFIQNRKFDRIGLVVYAGESFTQCPITTDYNVLQKMMEEVQHAGLTQILDGTAIGMGLATGVNRLKDSETKSKIIVLMTDGVNTAGTIDPITAAEMASQFGIKVYTIGVGTRGMAPYPVRRGPFVTRQNMEVQIDEELLKEIAQKTDGQYYRAVDEKSLVNIYQEIDRLEKTEVEVTAIKRYTEKFHQFALLAAILMLGEILLRNTIFRGLP